MSDYKITTAIADCKPEATLWRDGQKVATFYGHNCWQKAHAYRHMVVAVDTVNQVEGAEMVR